MAALKNANNMPNGVDDLNDSTVGPNLASSGWSTISGYTYVPSATFAFITEAALVDGCPEVEPGGVASDWPESGQRIPHPSGVR